MSWHNGIFLTTVNTQKSYPDLTCSMFFFFNFESRKKIIKWSIHYLVPENILPLVFWFQSPSSTPLEIPVYLHTCLGKFCCLKHSLPWNFLWSPWFFCATWSYCTSNYCRVKEYINFLDSQVCTCALQRKMHKLSVYFVTRDTCTY